MSGTRGWLAWLILPVVALFLLTVPLHEAFSQPRQWRNAGWSDLEELLGEGNVPNATGVRGAFVEPGMIDRDHADFEGKNLIFPTPQSEAANSTNHGQTCGRIFFGNTRSMANGMTDVELWLSPQWGHVVGRTLGSEEAYSLLFSENTRVSTHSYGDGGSLNTWQPLVGMDRLVHRYSHIALVGMPNRPGETGGSERPWAVWGSAFNSISVGRTDRGHPPGTREVGSDVYVSDRSKPDIVGPYNRSSFATPFVAAASAILVGVSQDNRGLSKGSFETPAGHTIYHADAAETIKAILMAGADRETDNDRFSDIADWGQGRNRLDNNLDRRFGAGQVNIYNSYRILAAGEQLPSETDLVAKTGWDYNPEFSRDDTPTYFFEASDNDKLQAVLTWHLNTEVDLQSQKPILYNLELVLYDATDADNWVELDRAACTVNNTQSVSAQFMERGRRYALQVVANDANQEFTWPYALAWRTDEGPEPDTVPPTIELHEPSWGTTILGSTIIRATAEDDRPGVTVQFYVNNEPWGDVQHSEPFEITISPQDFPGERRIQVGATAIDAAGNETQARPLNLQLVEDPRPPTVSVRSRERPEGLELTIRARDRYGIRTIRIELLEDGVDEPIELEFLDINGEETVVNHTFTHPVAGMPPGTHEFRVTVVDLAGNETVETVRYRR